MLFCASALCLFVLFCASTKKHKVLCAFLCFFVLAQKSTNLAMSLHRGSLVGTYGLTSTITNVRINSGSCWFVFRLSCAPPDPPVTSKIKETIKINMYPERATQHQDAEQ